VMAIAAGIADGLGFGTNARAALITRGLMEIMRLGVAMGGRQETFMGLSGLGDLVLTCTDNQSRNRRFGLALAKGQSAEEARASIGQAVEGIRTADAVVRLSEHYNIEMPISTQVQRIILGEINARDAVHELLSRKPGAELE
jgi:glycerol-3-phosphate dehydrogenase (NAD(P)+)